MTLHVNMPAIKAEDLGLTLGIHSGRRETIPMSWSLTFTHRLWYTCVHVGKQMNKI